jgi:hypothetical protein
MKHIQFIQLLIISSIFLTACVTKPADTKTPTIAQDINQVTTGAEKANNMLDFYENYSQLNATSQKLIFDEMNTSATEANSNVQHTLKLATILSTPNSHFRDINKAQSLLQELMSSKTLNTQELAYTHLLYEYGSESIRQQQKLKDESKKTESLEQKNEMLQKRIDALEQKNESLQKRYDVIEQKLINLKNIEKTLNGRDVKTNEKSNP